MNATTPGPIVRELSPRGPGGITVLEITGPGALASVRRLAPDVALGRGSPALARLVDCGDELDEALVLVDGDERVEVHVHGSPPLVRRLVGLLGTERADAATASRSLEEAAESMLANAPCDAAARILLDQIDGALRREIEALARASDAEFRERLEPLIERGRVAAFALRPATVVLAGEVNAGKSTLFNLLYGRTRVVVSASEGTTRDAVRERVRFGAWPVDLVDTAGERELSASSPERAAAIERDGQALARELRESADLVVWLEPASARSERPRELASKTVVVTSQADRLEPRERLARAPWISALLEPEHASRAIEDVFRGHFRLPSDPWSRGAAVPFEPSQLAALLQAGAASGRAARIAALELLLDRGSLARAAASSGLSPR